MKRENIADRGIWTAKKRYILNVWDSEGVRYEEPKLKMMGIEAVKSSTPAPCRKMIKDALKLMMTGTEDDVIDLLIMLVQSLRNFPQSRFLSLVLYLMLRSINLHLTIYAKGTPIHVRGALLYNHYIKEKNLTNKYSLIKMVKRLSSVI